MDCQLPIYSISDLSTLVGPVRVAVRKSHLYSLIGNQTNRKSEIKQPQNHWIIMRLPRALPPQGVSSKINQPRRFTGDEALFVGKKAAIDPAFLF
jgi:hypothetical protein